MQLVNDAPVAHPQPVAVTALQLRDVAVHGVRVSSNLFDLCHNPLLQIHRNFVTLLCMAYGSVATSLIFATIRFCKFTGSRESALAKDFVVTTLYIRTVLP